jgi:hypothetical protein
MNISRMKNSLGPFSIAIPAYGYNGKVKIS